MMIFEAGCRDERAGLLLGYGHFSDLSLIVDIGQSREILRNAFPFSGITRRLEALLLC